MTRITPIPMTKLSDQLLRSAIGEEPRILYSVLYRINVGKSFNDIPSKFTLGTGHMTFFFNKCEYIFHHYLLLRQEYVQRFYKRYSIEHLSTQTDRYAKIAVLRPDLCQNYVIPQEAIDIVLNRILERSKEYKQHTYYGKPIKNWKKFLNK